MAANSAAQDIGIDFFRGTLFSFRRTTQCIDLLPQLASFFFSFSSHPKEGFLFNKEDLLIYLFTYLFIYLIIHVQT